MTFDILSTLAILAFIILGFCWVNHENAKRQTAANEVAHEDLYERLAQTLVFDRRGYDAPPLLEDTQGLPDLSEETALPAPPVSEAEWQAMDVLELMEE